MRTFGQSVRTLVTGTVIVQAIPILAMPILTRLYLPQDFAILASFVAVISVLGTLVTGRYEMAIMHAETSNEAYGLAQLSLLISFLASLIIGFICYLFAEPVSVLIGQPIIVHWLPFIFFPLLATGAIQTFSVLLNWHKDYHGISVGRIIQNLVNATFGIGVGFIKWSPGLLFGHIIGLVSSTLFFRFKSGSKVARLTLSQLITIAQKYKQYPIYSAPAALLDTASTSSCIFILGKFYPQNILGQFALTHRLLLIPMVLIGTSVGQVFFQHAAEVYRKGDLLHSLLVSTCKKLLLYSLPAFLFLIFFAPYLFAFVFGESWRVAGEFTRLVAAAYWFRFAVSPVSSIFMVLHRLKVGTFWQFIYFCTSILVLGGCAYVQLPIQLFLGLYAVHEVVLYGFYFWLAHKICLEQSRVEAV